MQSIDKEIQKNVILFLEEELGNEINGKADMVLINNPICLSNYINYVCKINFMPCDLQSKKKNIFL